MTEPFLHTILLALLLAGVGLVVYGSLTYFRQTHNTQISQPLTAMDTVAALLAPIWLTLIAYILIALVRMVDDFNPAQQTANLRWHILAFLGLITALGALVSAPSPSSASTRLSVKPAPPNKAT
ncbi:hypothetical protein SAMN05216227_104026 [Pseudorhodobacter antarcticus]|uniref:Uncharacterized protein n=2 Tax=Pseudorhodobacter antarcticus TaxID=1077947 RepID=A0A1H8LBP0_9RHOB|nr:hypothetical protein [Pseudorhodobacter antarcticus]SEO02503.1 hypothetical protein SAMN05216227_104026 [Pseudorhodobacter antarcticus]